MFDLSRDERNRLFLACCALVLLVEAVCSAQFRLGDRTTIAFAGTEEGRKILTTRDAFIRALSPFDRAVFMRTNRPTTNEAFLEFVDRSVLDWTEEEIASTSRAFETIKPKLERLALPWPETIHLIKTTDWGLDGARYTRDNSIVFPQDDETSDWTIGPRLFCHELFHILSRNDPDLRDRMYALIGFVRCNEVVLPDMIARRKLTNPDAPTNDHFIRLTWKDRSVYAIPLLVAQPDYDVRRGWGFFDYMQFRLLLTERDPNSLDLKPIYENRKPVLVDVNDVKGFYEQIGRNTDYIISPEEILADNFVSLVMEDPNVPTPDLLRKLEQVLTQPIASDPNRKDP